MNGERTQGLTLIETLFAIAGMAILLATTYATVRQSLDLHKKMLKESARIAFRCELAEQLTADLHANRAVKGAQPDGWSVTRADGTIVAYFREKELLVRVEQSVPPKRKVFEVGRWEVSYRGSEPGWSDSLSESKPVNGVRLKFSNSELIVAR